MNGTYNVAVNLLDCSSTNFLEKVQQQEWSLKGGPPFITAFFMGYFVFSMVIPLIYK